MTINYTVSDASGATSDSTVTVNVGNNTPPSGADVVRSLPEDGSYTLQTADFGFSDADAGQTLAGVRIDALPAAGTLLLNGNPVAAGTVVSAAQLAAGPGSGPPTSTARAVRSLADGLLMTLDQPYSTAAARLGQSLGPAAGTDVAMPDSAAALTTLAALHAGDVVRVRAVIGRAVELTDGDAVFGPRHRLLRAWVRMQDGQLGAAGADLEAVAAGAALHRREALWLSTLRDRKSVV